MALLSHYYQPEVPAGVDELAMADWISVLGDLPQEAVTGAIQEWLRDETRRPTPAGIRKLALARIERPRPVVFTTPFAPAPRGDMVVPDEELARRREVAERARAEFPMLKRIPKSDAD